METGGLGGQSVSNSGPTPIDKTKTWWSHQTSCMKSSTKQTRQQQLPSPLKGIAQCPAHCSDWFNSWLPGEKTQKDYPAGPARAYGDC